MTKTWEFLSTPAWDGQLNMDFDRQTLESVAIHQQGPTARFFRWKVPSVSHGRLQPRSTVEALAPQGWPIVQRPTGGGIVLHDQDLCISLAWPDELSGFPSRAADIYPFIHGIFLEALRFHVPLTMLACCDAPPPSAPFDRRQCFVDPVAADLLVKNQKVIGGALFHRKGAWLYQGSLQWAEAGRYEPVLRDALETRLCA